MSALPGKAVTTPTAAVAAARNQAACGCAPAIATPRMTPPATAAQPTPIRHAHRMSPCASASRPAPTASPTVRISATGTPTVNRFRDVATTKAMKLCRPSPLGPRKRAPATEIASAQSCGVRFAAAFQMPPRVTEVPVVAAAAVDTEALASTGRAERSQDVVGVRVEAEGGLELPDGRRLSPRPQVGLSELEPEVDLPRLLPHGGAERRDVCRRAGERSLGLVGRGREGVEPAGAAPGRRRPRGVGGSA